MTKKNFELISNIANSFNLKAEENDQRCEVEAGSLYITIEEDYNDELFYGNIQLHAGFSDMIDIQGTTHNLETIKAFMKKLETITTVHPF